MSKLCIYFAFVLVAFTNAMGDSGSVSKSEDWNLSVKITSQQTTPVMFDLKFIDRVVNFKVRRFPVLENPGVPELDFAFRLGITEARRTAIDKWKKYLTNLDASDKQTGLDGVTVELILSSNSFSKQVIRWSPDLKSSERNLDELNALLLWLGSTSGVFPRPLL